MMRGVGQKLLRWGLLSSIVVFVGDMVTGQPCSNSWSTLFPGDGGLGAVTAVILYDSEILVGGTFQLCMNRNAYGVARWNGRRWGRLGCGLADPNDWSWSPTSALVLFADDPNAPEAPLPFAGADDGLYKFPGNPDNPNQPWTRIANSNAPVRALAVYQSILYVGGEFTEIGEQTASCIARWDGQTWSTVGGGVGDDPNDPNSPAPKVLALTVFDDGGGEALFVGGTFLTAGGVSTNRIARW